MAENSRRTSGNLHSDKLPKKCRFPGYRFVVAILLFAGVVNSFVMRVNLSVAIVSMVDDRSEASKSNATSENGTCAGLKPQTLNQSSVPASEAGKRYDWDIRTQSWILGSFFYGYALFQLPSSVLVQRWGGKRLFGGAITVTSLLTLLTPLATEYGPETVIAARAMQGVVQGVVFPSVYLLIANWAPDPERNRIFTFVASGSAFGNIIGMMVSGMLANTKPLGGWPLIFYVTGAFGCLWCILWIVLMYETPSHHPWISQEEKDFIENNLGDKNNRNESASIPWCSILKSIPMWAYVVALFGHSIGLYIVMTEMPTYLSNILYFDIKTNGVLCALPFFLQMVFGMGSGYLADGLRRKFQFSNTVIRKVINSIGIFGSGICIMLVGVVGCRTVLSVTLLCLSAGLNSVCYAGCVITCVEMSPKYSATILGISLSVSNLAGAAVPYMVGEVTNSGQTVENWTLAFIVTGILMMATGIFFDLFGSAEVQHWNPTKTVVDNNETSPLSDTFKAK